MSVDGTPTPFDAGESPEFRVKFGGVVPLTTPCPCTLKRGLNIGGALDLEHWQMAAISREQICFVSTATTNGQPKSGKYDAFF